MRIKICGITRCEDAKVAVAAGVDALGLVFARSPRQVTPKQADKIIKILPPYIVKIGVFVDQNEKWIQELTNSLGLDRIQFHGAESNQMLGKFARSRVIRVLRPQPNEKHPPKDPAPAAAAFLIDSYVTGQPGGTGILSNWEYAKRLKQFGKAIILSGGLNYQNVGKAIKTVRPDMIDVSSGVESRPGIKSKIKIERFIKAVRKNQ